MNDPLEFGLSRRWFLGFIAAGVRMATACAALAAWPIAALAGERNRAAFDAKSIDDAVLAAGVAEAVDSDEIVLRAPDIAENSALVHLEILSKLPDTQSILLFAEKNPQPLVAQFDVLPGMEPFVAVRIKMAESAFLRVVVKAGDKFYVTRRETKVTLGGCAG